MCNTGFCWEFQGTSIHIVRIMSAYCPLQNPNADTIKMVLQNVTGEHLPECPLLPEPCRQDDSAYFSCVFCSGVGKVWRQKKLIRIAKYVCFHDSAGCELDSMKCSFN